MPEIEKKSLHTRTLDLLTGVDARTKNGGPSANDISKATGITVSWIYRFRNGDFKTPSVDRVQLIYEFITKESLNVK